MNSDKKNLIASFQVDHTKIVPGVYESRVGAIPLGKLGEVEDIANAVFFLSSPEAQYINGANIVVDGGFVVNGLKPLNIQVD